MSSFWNVLGDLAGDVLEFVDPTPGNLLLGRAADVLQGEPQNGRAGVSTLPTPTNGRYNGSIDVTPEPRSALGEYLEYLVPDPVERLIGTMDPVLGNGSCQVGPVVVAPQVTQRLKAPPGYRIVECPKGSGRKVAMREETARKFGYLSRRSKPPISATDWNALKRADRTVRKLDRVVQMSNRVVGKRKYRRAAPAAPKRTTRRR